MLSLWLLPLGYFVLSRGKTKKYSSPVTSRTGLIINSNRIEIINRDVAFNLIDTRILEYCEKNKTYLMDVNVIDLFKYVLFKISPSLFAKFKAQKLSQKEKVILGLFFIIVFNRILNILGPEESKEFLEKFETREEPIIHYLLGLSNSDLDDLEIIENRFRITYSYP